MVGAAMARAGREHDEQEAAQPAPAEPARATAPSPAARVLALQRSAGNAAVAAALGRRPLARNGGGPAAPVAAPPDPRAVAVEASDPKAADKMTLADFNAFTERQVDWASQASFIADPDATRQLREIVRLAQDDDKALLGAAGELKIKDLRKVIDKDAAKLAAYGKAVTAAGWTPATTVKDAVAWGDAADKLIAAMTLPIVAQTVKQGPEGTNVEDLIKAKAVDDYAAFVTKTKPLLSATNGAEVRSFLALKAEGDWKDFDGQVGPVRNIHHFRKGALKGLKKNVADKSRAKPLAVVLHSTVDHNGAFHRDENIDQIATSPKSNTILIEGSGTLDAAGASLESAVKDYGQGTPPKARQIMLAGHGNSRVTELAGDRDPGTGAITEEAVDLDHNAKESLELIDIMLKNLDSDPKARIVLNGCLTASSSATPPLPRGAGAAERKQAKDDLAKELAANKSLADTIRDMAAKNGIKRDQVSAALSSFGNEVSLIDPKTGDLGLRSPDDPLMTSADKFAYVAQAGEATGAGRALVECILADPVKAEQSAKARLTISKARTDWDDRIIKVLYKEALKDLGDIAFVNLAAELSGGISECQFAGLCRPHMISSAEPDVLDRMLKPLVTEKAVKDQKPPLMQVVFNQVWMLSDATKQAPFLQALAKMTVQEAHPFVDVALIAGELPALLPDPPGANAAGELRLALLDVAENGASADPASIGYLRKRRSGAEFANPQEITKALGGRTSAANVLEDIKEPVPVGPPASGAAAPPDPDYNVDTDGDGKNDLYVEPMVVDGVNVSKAVGGPADNPVYQKPDASSKELGKLPDGGSVHITGKTGVWYCIEFGPDKKPGFAKNILTL
jgi:hypothetical protein